MTTTRLRDGLEIACLSRSEARVLDSHVEGYFRHGIALKPGDVVFDVGANIGVFGLRAILAHPGVQVWAFEPLPPIYAVLKDNASRLGQGRLHAMPFGLSGEAGEMNAWFFPNAPALSSGHMELWEQNPAAWEEAVSGSLEHPAPGMEWMGWVPRFLTPLLARHLRSGAQQHRCRLSTLSSVIAEHRLSSIDLLKIDCEGAEEAVLSGLSEEDGARVHQAVVEVFDTGGRADRVEERLRRMGLHKVVREKEAALASTPLINLYARRS
jgi:FkbM family methyltransferase